MKNKGSRQNQSHDFISAVGNESVFKYFAVTLRGIHLFRRLLNGNVYSYKALLCTHAWSSKLKEQRGYDSLPVGMLIANTLETQLICSRESLQYFCHLTFTNVAFSYVKYHLKFG